MINIRKNLRIAAKLALLVCLPLTGALWANSNDQRVLFYAIAMTFLSITTAFVAETLISSTEEDIDRLKQRISDDRFNRAKKLALLDSKIKKNEDTLSILESQNRCMQDELDILRSNAKT